MKILESQFMARIIFNRKKSRRKRNKKKILFKVLSFLGIGISFFILFIFGVFIYYAKDLPRPEDFNEAVPIQSTKIYDRTGKVLLYEIYGEEKREIVPFEQISDYLKKAVIATEDAKFYEHYGIDFEGILRAIKIDFQLGRPVYGGSTISQQLIRSTFLNTQKKVSRKIREIILTIELERRYGKDQILGWYLNQVPFGPNLYGVQSAAKSYFNKDAKELSLAESATLAALIKAPSYYSNKNNYDKLLERRDYVLDRMVQENYISESEAKKAKEEKIVLNQNIRSIKAPHFVLYVQEYLFNKYGKDFLERGGFKIYTSLDWHLQELAEKIVKEGAEKNKILNAYNAALVAVDPKTGQILAMVGSKDWWAEPEGCVKGDGCKFDPKVNVATYNIGRQPGSAFKPFVYVTAFQKGYSDKTIVIDEKTDFGVWGGKHYIPNNYDGRFRGPVTLRQALAQSLNVPSVKVLINFAGIKDSIETAKKFGITTLNQPVSFYGPSIVLGGGEVKLLDMVIAYSVFASEGLKVPPVSILKIEDSEGNIIEQTNVTPKRVIDKRSVQLINSILSDNIARAPMFGANSPLYFPGYDVAVKTGTTNNFRDAWTIGYTPSIVVGVWAGNNNNDPMIKKPSVTISAPIWRSFMEKVLPTLPNKKFTPIDESDYSEKLPQKQVIFD